MIFINAHVELFTGLVLVTVYCLLRAADIAHIEVFGSGHSRSGSIWPLEASGLVLMLFGSAKMIVVGGPRSGPKKPGGLDALL
jgi:hypothetical protein